MTYSTEAAEAHRFGLRRLVGAGGVYLVLASIVTGVLGWFVIGLLESITQADAIEREAFSRFVQTLIGGRNWFPLLVVPALAAGIVALRSKRASWRWGALTVGVIALLIPFGLLLAGFVLTIGPFYQAREL